MPEAAALNQPLEGMKALGGLAGAAIVLWIVYSFADVLLVDASNRAPGGYGGAVANQWLNTGLDTLLPALFLLLVFFGLVARAVIARRYVR
jgi:hypothetical protein